MNTCHISPLEERPDDAKCVAEWIASEWGRLPIHEYLDTIRRHDAWLPALPRTLVAHVKDQVVGTVSILEDDLETRPEFNPWLGCLYVAHGWRRRGIGVDLLSRAETLAASNLAIRRLFLFTEAQADLYGRHGWLHLEYDTYRNKPITIMTKGL